MPSNNSNQMNGLKRKLENDRFHYDITKKKPTNKPRDFSLTFLGRFEAW